MRKVSEVKKPFVFMFLRSKNTVQKLIYNVYVMVRFYTQIIFKKKKTNIQLNYNFQLLFSL